MNKQNAGITIEYFDDKFAALLENVELIVERKTRQVVAEELDIRLAPIETDIKTIKAAVTDTNRQVQNLDHRVGKLEAAL